LPISYRTFRNPDPPALVRIWNEAFAGRGAAFLQGTTPLEHYVLAKPYFDPGGLIVAESDGIVVGFVHAGFGADAAVHRLVHETGVISTLAVEPGYRGRGIGKSLLRLAETYLRLKGASAIYFGGVRPHCPFYWGMYGGSEPSGVLTSDPSAEPFLRKCGYVPIEARLILQRQLDQPLGVADPRFSGLRRRLEVKISPRPSSRKWYEESAIGPLEMLYFQLVQTAGGELLGEARVWDMDLFGWRWHQPAAGIVDLTIAEGHRRQGLGKYLLVQVLRYLQDQFFTLAETQVNAGDAAALALCRGLGFNDVDEGRIYQLQQ
jgi:ribosomal protein S18 acetylase RimI-like enzyme